MDNQEQPRTHTQGHEGHGASYVCYKCGWLFPNPHPSAKQRRAHKKICGTIEGCKLLVSESQSRLNASDDEHVFDVDCNTQVDSVPNSLDAGVNEKQRGGTGENLTRSGDEVFLDAIANFSDGALSPGVRDPLRDSLESATDVELVHIKYPEFSRFSWDNDLNAVGASENVMDCSLTSKIKSNTDLIEIVVSSGNSVGETCEGGKYNPDCPVAGGAFSLNEKNNAEFLSVIPQTKLLLEVNSTQSTKGSTNGVPVVSADITQFATSTDAKMSQEKREENINVFTHPSWDDELDKAHPQNKYEDVKDHEGVLLQNSLSLHSSEGLKQNQDDLKGYVAVESSFLINPSQLSERREVLPDVHVLHSSIKEKNIIELVDEEIKEINNVAVDVTCRGASAGIDIKTKQSSNLDLEVKPSSGLNKSDEAVEMCKIEKCDTTDAQYKDKHANSYFECPILSEVVIDMTISTRKGAECTDRGPLSGAQQDIKGDEVNSDGRGNEECIRFVGSSVDPYQTQDVELIVKADPCISVAEDAQDGEPVKKVFGCTDVPVCKDKLASSAIHTSVDPGSCFDSFKGDSDSLSVSGLSSTEAAKFGSKDPKTASHRQQCEKSELFEPPSFMTLVEPGLVNDPKAAASEVHERTETNEHASTSQAAWFPTITHVTNESQGRKRNEEKIAEITNGSPSKQQKPLRTLLGEASRKMKAKPPKLEQNSVHQKNSVSVLTTGNSSIPGRESPATQAVKGKNGKERDSPARYTSGTKRQNKKVKGRPHWIPFVCCSSADVQQS